MRLVLAGLVWAFDIEAVREMDWAQQKTYLVSGRRRHLRFACEEGFRFTRRDRKRGGWTVGEERDRWVWVGSSSSSIKVPFINTSWIFRPRYLCRWDWEDRGVSIG